MIHLIRRSIRLTYILAITVALLALSSANAGAQEALIEALTEQVPLKVFVCAGQSNMVGARSRAKDLPEELRAEAPNILVFNAKTKKWTPMVPNDRGFGPEVSFAHAMQKELGEPVGIIKHSVGGTSLNGPWNPTTPGKLYSVLRDVVKAAGETRKIEVVGMLWMQGEKDSRTEDNARKYAELLPQLIAQSRKDFGNEKMFFVAGRVNPPERFTHASIVRKAQEECKADGYAWVDCDKLTKGGDNLHYDTQGQVDLGKLFAEATLRLIKEQEEKEEAAD